MYPSPSLLTTPRSLWLSGYGTDKPLVKHALTLNTARKAAGSANSAFYSTPLKFLQSKEQHIAVSKAPMLALLTNEGASSSPQWSVSNAGYSANEALVDVVSHDEEEIETGEKGVGQCDVLMRVLVYVVLNAK